MAITREPIQLTRHAVAVIHIFARHDKIQDLGMLDDEEYEKECWDRHTKAAKQFIEQLEGYWTPRFLQALRDEITERLRKPLE